MLTMAPEAHRESPVYLLCHGFTLSYCILPILFSFSHTQAHSTTQGPLTWLMYQHKDQLSSSDDGP